MSEWKPISSAPKDGTVVLLHAPSRPTWNVVSAYWRKDWRVPGWDTISKHQTFQGATHWMHLPEPPTDTHG